MESLKSPLEKLKTHKAFGGHFESRLWAQKWRLSAKELAPFEAFDFSFSKTIRNSGSNFNGSDP